MSAEAAENLHPSLWRASQLARSRGRVVDTGYPALSSELPGGGWPVGALVDLLVQRPGVGELRMLRPALATVAARPVVLLQPPHTPNAHGLSYIGLPVDKVMQVKAPKTADALWSAEQVLRAGTCGALVFWMQHVQASSLRRLHLAAQASETLFFMVRPAASAQDSSPAVLRLLVKPAADGVAVEIVKRRGPALAEPISIALPPSPVLLSPYRREIRRPVRTPAPRMPEATEQEHF
jgi:hypothetical protein